MPEEPESERLLMLEQRVAVLEAERDRLQGELDAIANRATDRWLSAVQFESATLAAMQQTVSWRVTRPLRAVRGMKPPRFIGRRDG